MIIPHLLCIPNATLGTESFKEGIIPLPLAIMSKEKFFHPVDRTYFLGSMQGMTISQLPYEMILCFTNGTFKKRSLYEGFINKKMYTRKKTQLKNFTSLSE